VTAAAPSRNYWDDTTHTPGYRHAAPTRTLASEFHPRNNALNFMRLMFACIVAVVHASILGLDYDYYVGHTAVGSLAVDAFFIISGFLVSRSWLRLNSLPRYLWHRAIRIMPGFWVCMLVSAFGVAPLLALIVGRSPTSVLTGEDSSIGYLINNAALLMRQFGIAGLPGVGGNPEVINGSLWTLFYEACCYLIIAGLGVLGILRWRPALVLAMIAVLWLLTIAAEFGINPLGSDYLRSFALIFLIGTAGLLYADRIPLSGYIALGSLGVAVAAMFLFVDYRVLGAPAYAYLIFYLMVRMPVPWQPRSDISYGMYVWHWPIAQTLVALKVPEYIGPLFIVLVLALAVPVSALSWHLVEKPVLRFKDISLWPTEPATERPSRRRS